MEKGEISGDEITLPHEAIQEMTGLIIEDQDLVTRKLRKSTENRQSIRLSPNNMYINSTETDFPVYEQDEFQTHHIMR